MTILRRVLVPVAALSVGALTLVAPQGAASARTVDERCLGSAPLPASALAHGTAGIGCSLVGRVVYAGRAAVVVPPAGVTVAGEGVSSRGEVTGLRVSNDGTSVRSYVGSAGGRHQKIQWVMTALTTSSSTPSTSSTTASPTTTTTTRRAGSPPACQDRTYHLEGHHWSTRLRYRANLTKAPARYRKTTLVRQIRAANTNMRKGVNTCGRPALRTPVGDYLGRTSVRPNIRPNLETGAITCGAYNTRNVVGFGNLPGNLLGWTCYWWVSGGRMNAADIMMDTGRLLTTHLPATCSNRWDFEGALTHEFGHAYGLAHTGSGHANLTMQHILRPCSTYARTLGLGDWLGMKKMYGAR